MAAREKREDSLRESGAEAFQQCERGPEALHGADTTLKGSHVYDVCIKKKRQKDPLQKSRVPNKKRCQAFFPLRIKNNNLFPFLEQPKLSPLSISSRYVLLTYSQVTLLVSFHFCFQTPFKFASKSPFSLLSHLAQSLCVGYLVHIAFHALLIQLLSNTHSTFTPLPLCSEKATSEGQPQAIPTRSFPIRKEKGSGDDMCFAHDRGFQTPSAIEILSLGNDCIFD